MKRNIMKKIALMAIVMSIVTNVTLAEASTTQTLSTTVNGSISATVLNVSVPTSIAFTVDPNNATNTYLSSEAAIINDSSAPITVSIGVGNNFRQSATSAWKPIDFLPSELEWGKLGKSGTESSLALGVKISNEAEWRKVTRNTTLWVKEQKSTLSPVIFGDLNPKSSAKVTLEVYHGNSFSEAKTCSYDIIWSFTLAE